MTLRNEIFDGNRLLTAVEDSEERRNLLLTVMKWWMEGSTVGEATASDGLLGGGWC